MSYISLSSSQVLEAKARASINALLIHSSLMIRLLHHSYMLLHQIKILSFIYFIKDCTCVRKLHGQSRLTDGKYFLLQCCEQLFNNQTLLRTILINYITCELPPKKKWFELVQTRTKLHENQIMVWFGSGNGLVPVQLRRVIFRTGSISGSQKNAPKPNQTEPQHH